MNPGNVKCQRQSQESRAPTTFAVVRSKYALRGAHCSQLLFSGHLLVLITILWAGTSTHGSDADAKAQGW